MTNRIINAIERIRKALESENKGADAEKSISAKLDLDMKGFCIFQDKKSAALAIGRITVDEAVTIYRLLGSNPADFNGRDLATKITLTKVFLELL